MDLNFTGNATLSGGTDLQTIGPRAVSSLDIIIGYMRFYYTPCLVALGIVGNLTSCLVFLLSKLRKFSSSHYLACIVLSNTLYFVVLLLKWMDMFLEIRTYNRPFICQVVSLTSQVSSFLALWATVAFVVDRYIANCWSVEAPNFCTILRARVVIISLCVMALVVYLNISLTVDVLLYRGVPSCRPLPLYRSMMRVVEIMDMFLNHIMAYLVILILFILTVNSLFCCSGDARYNDSNTHLAVVTVSYTLVYLIVNLPSECIYLTQTLTSVFMDRSPFSRITQMNLMYADMIALYTVHTAKAMHFLFFALVHPFFWASIKTRVRKILRCLSSCYRKKMPQKAHLEEQISLQEAV